MPASSPVPSYPVRHTIHAAPQNVGCASPQLAGRSSHSRTASSASRRKTPSPRWSMPGSQLWRLVASGARPASIAATSPRSPMSGMGSIRVNPRSARTSRSRTTCVTLAMKALTSSGTAVGLVWNSALDRCGSCRGSMKSILHAASRRCRCHRSRLRWMPAHTRSGGNSSKAGALANLRNICNLQASSLSLAHQHTHRSQVGSDRTKAVPRSRIRRPGSMRWRRRGVTRVSPRRRLEGLGPQPRTESAAPWKTFASHCARCLA